MPSLGDILRKYGTSLAETRRLAPELGGVLKQPRQPGMPAIKAPTVTTFLTSDEAKNLGVNIEPDWMLKLTPSTADKRGFTASFVTPQKWEMLETGAFISPEGYPFTRQQMEAQWAKAEAQQREREQTQAVFGRVFPDEKNIDKLLAWAGQSEQNLNQFYQKIQQAGRTPDTEYIIKRIVQSAKPEATEEEVRQQIERFYTPPTITEQAKEVWREIPWLAKPVTPIGETKGWWERGPDPGDLLEWLAPTKIGAGLGVVGAYLEKYVGRPWESAVMGNMLATYDVLQAAGVKPTSDIQARMEEINRRAIEKYGIGSMFSEEVSEAWKLLGEEVAPIPGGKFAQTAVEWLNPIYLIPIGGQIGWIAKFTSKIPLLGKVMKYVATGVQAVEKGAAYPITKPIELVVKGVEKVGELGVKGVEKVGASLGEAAMNQIIKQSKLLIDIAEIPTNERIASEVLRDNWMKRALQTVAKLPGGKAGIEKALGWRVLINREGKALEDIIGSGAAVNGYIRRAGINTAAYKVWELRGIEGNPVKLFGFGKNAFSGKMLARLLPEYKGLAEAGTLEHIFTHPEMYNWSGMGKGLDYVTRVHEINTQVLNMLKKEGVPPKNLIEDWIHRVVTGKEKAGKVVEVKGRPGVGGRRVGAKPAYEKPRQYETMADGIAAGIRYDVNPEVSIKTYIEGAFQKVGDERFLKYTEEFGVTPTERLAERYPEVVAVAELTKTELADAAKFQSVVNRAIRGEKIPEQTLKAIEARFPDIARRFRNLVKEPSIAEKQLRGILAENEASIRDLTWRLKVKEEAIRVKPPEVAPKAVIPDETKLSEAFKVMDYQDRVAFRRTMEGQAEEVGRLSFEQSEELAGIKEFLETDAVASYKGRIGNREVSLTSLLIHGEWPETILRPQAELLLQGRQLKPFALTPEGRVKWEYIIDELADHFKLTEDQLIARIEQAAKYKVRAEDLKGWNVEYNERYQGIKRMLKILDDVDAVPEFMPEMPKAAPKVGIPKAEAGMPEAGLQKDMFGYDTPVFPKGKGEVTQMGMDDYAKLAKIRADAGLPPPEGYVKPKIEGLPGYEGETTFIRQKPEMPSIKTSTERRKELTSLRDEVRTLTETRKAPYWKARAEKAFRMEQVRQPNIGEGYLPQPFAGGKIYTQEFIDSFNKFFGYEKGLNVLKPIADVAGILRITKAALDFSAMAIQGLPSWGLAHSMLLFDPANGLKLMGSWYKTFAYSVGSFFDPGIMARYIEKNTASVSQRVTMGGSVRVVDWINISEFRGGFGGKAQKVMGWIPLKPYHRAEVSFFASGEMVRDEFWKILSPKAIANGKEFELARTLDRITGIAELSDLPITTRQLEQAFVWFAPNYTRACLTVLADIFRGGYTGAMARKAIGGMIAAGAGMFAGIQYALASLESKSHEDAMEAVSKGFGVSTDPITGETTWKPTASFMTIKIGNYNFGFGGFWYGLLRLSGNIMACINEMGDKERIDLVKIIKNGSLNKDNPFVYWFYSRSSPLVGTGFELSSGKGFLGYPIETPEEYRNYILTRFEPIWAEQGLNWLIPGMARQNEIPEGMAKAALIPAELFGLRSFPEGSWAKFYDKGSEIINRLPKDVLEPYFKPDELQKILEVQRKGKLEWAMLPPPLQIKLRMMYPDLDSLYEEAQADSAIRSSKDWQQWTAEQDEAKKTYYDRGNDTLARVRIGELDTRELREKWSDAGTMYGITLDQIEKNPAFQKIRDYFDKREAKGDKYNWNINKVLSEYTKVVFSEYLDPHGDFDFAKRDEAVNTFIKKYGEDTYQIIKQMYADKKEMAFLAPALIRLADDKDKLGREYWKLPWKPVYQLDEADVPAQYKSLWSEYKALDTETERDEFLDANPDMAKDWRSEYRLAHPEDDARLALWGYGGKLQGQKAYDLVVQWSRELNIPLAQMGLGLPPQNLIQNYFEYNKVVDEFRGGSAQAKLYKIKHPEWYSWGKENLGWLEIEDNPKALELSVKWDKLDAQYQSYSSRKSANYIATEAGRENAREKLLEANPEYTKDRRRRDAYNIDGFPDNLVETYVEWYSIEKKDYQDDWFLMEHKDFYDTMVKLDKLKARDFREVPPKGVYTKYLAYQKLPEGNARIRYRQQNKDLDDWMVAAGKVSKPVATKGVSVTIPKLSKEQQRIEEAKAFKKRIQERMK